MQYGICAGLDSLAVKPSKLDFYEIYVSDLVPKEDDAAFAPRAEAIRNAVAPVRAANCFIPGALKTTGPDVDIEALDAYVQVALQRAGQVGIETIVFGSGGSRMVPEGFSMTEATDQLVASLTRWAPMAKAAAMPRPSAIPPAATSGIFSRSRAWGTSGMVEFRPTWPPPSHPETITPSAPSASALVAALTVGTTGKLFTPPGLRILMIFSGLPVP